MTKYALVLILTLTSGASYAYSTNDGRGSSVYEDLEIATGSNISVQTNDFIFVYEKSGNRTVVSFLNGKKLGTFSQVPRDNGATCNMILNSENISNFTIINVLPGATFKVVNEYTGYSPKVLSLSIENSNSVTLNGQPLKSNIKLKFILMCMGEDSGYFVKITPAAIKKAFDTALIVSPTDYNIISIEPK